MFSPLLAQLVEHLKCLPGVGTKSAQRMAIYLLQRNRQGGLKLAASLESALKEIQHCERCQTFSEHALCRLCADNRRNSSQLCVVETPADVIAIEQTNSYRGLYFVLMGYISPIDGIGPNEIGIPKLLQLVQAEAIEEVILATNATVEGDATAHFIANALKNQNASCTRIAHGVPIDGELGYLDTGTIARAFKARLPLHG
jgi:recombination protein RecR